MHFLISTCNVLSNPAIVKPLQPVVADLLIDKDRLFAELTLDHTEWRMYSGVYESQMEQLPRPDLVVYLQAA